MGFRFDVDLRWNIGKACSLRKRGGRLRRKGKNGYCLRLLSKSERDRRCGHHKEVRTGGRSVVGGGGKDAAGGPNAVMMKKK